MLKPVHRILIFSTSCCCNSTIRVHVLVQSKYMYVHVPEGVYCIKYCTDTIESYGMVKHLINSSTL